jgi:hypothetical protein
MWSLGRISRYRDDVIRAFPAIQAIVTSSACD